MQYSPSAVQPQFSLSDAYRHVPGQHQGNMDADMYLQPTNNSSYIREKPLQRNIHEHDSGKFVSSNSITTELVSVTSVTTECQSQVKSTTCYVGNVFQTKNCPLSVHRDVDRILRLFEPIH